jgi:malate:Na+ symporter
MLFVGIASIVATSAWAGLLPKNMIGGLAVIMTLGFAFAKIGRQIPVLKDIGGPAILCLMVPSCWFISACFRNIRWIPCIC